MSYVTPQELIYRALASPKTPETKSACVVTEVATIELTRADVDAIIQRKRAATPEELQEIIACEDFHLTSGERNQLGVDLSAAIAQRARQTHSRREDQNAKLIYDLGYAETPFGLLYERAWFQRELQSGVKAISECRRHNPPHCTCWREVRETLWYVRSSFPECSPEALTALRIWEALEEMEFASRPDRTAQ